MMPNVGCSSRLDGSSIWRVINDDPVWGLNGVSCAGSGGSDLNVDHVMRGMDVMTDVEAGGVQWRCGGDDVGIHGRAEMTGRRGVGFIEGDTVCQFLTARNNIIINDVFIGSGVAKEDTLAEARCQFTVTTKRVAGNNSGTKRAKVA